MKKATLERKRMEQFNRYWEALYQAVPDARRQAVEAMGQAVKEELDRRIDGSNFQAGAKPTIKRWQELSIGSGGGYAAIAPTAKELMRQPKSGKQKVWKGNPVSSRMVSKWLDQGHGTRQPAVRGTGHWNRVDRSGAVRTGKNPGYVTGRQFYSWTQMHAQELALAAADRVLSAIADEVDY